MNPLNHIKTNKFKELTANELKDVINAYVDQNRYEKYAPATSSKLLVQWFESKYYPVSVLKDFFNFWKN